MSVAAAQAIVRAALGVPVSSNVTSAPARFVRLTRSGGPREWAIDKVQVIVECYASTASGSPDSPQAERDALAAYDALSDASFAGPWAGRHISMWEGNSISDYPNPLYPKHARWQFTGALYVLRI